MRSSGDLVFSWAVGLVVAGFFILPSTGCIGSSGPDAVEAPDIDPEDAASNAVEMYDQDDDGAIGGAELDQVPALKASLKKYDTNGDLRIDEAELAKRLQAYYSAGVGLTPVDAVVKLDRRPLEGATVTFEPEPFLGEAVKRAEGTTDQSGVARVAVPDELLPEGQQGLNAMQVGIYKVKITHPTVTIPPKYNEETTLGYELDPKDLSSGMPTFDLTSR